MHGPASTTQSIFITLTLLSLLLAGVYLCIRLARMIMQNFPATPRMVAYAVTATATLFMMLFMSAWGLFVYLTLALAAGDVLDLVITWGCRAPALQSFRKRAGLEPCTPRIWQKFWRGGATGLLVAIAVCVYGYIFDTNRK